MNSTLKIALYISTLLIFSFKSFDVDLEKCLIKVGETISFSNKPGATVTKSYVSMQKGHFDGSGFKLTIDTVNNVWLSDIKPALGPKQDEFVIIGCTGNLTRNKEGLTVTFEKCRKNYFLINLDEGVLMASFDTIVKLQLVAEKPDGQPAEYFFAEKDQSALHMRKVITKKGTVMQDQKTESTVPSVIQNLHLTAVPAGIKKSDLYAARHAPTAIAQFTKIEVETRDGEIIPFKQGSYMLCEGNALAIK